MKREGSKRGTGWLTLALGLAEIATTRLVAKVPMPRRQGLKRVFGKRDVGTALGILSRQRRSPWIWARVAGDVMDLFTLGSAFASKKRRRGRIGAALAAVAGITALDIIYGRRVSRSH